jgi:hypothetical protein
LILLLIGFVTADVIRYNLKGGRDFNVFLTAAATLLTDDHLYVIESPTAGFYVYFPLFAMLFVPFTLLPPALALSIWTILNILLICWIVATFFRAMMGFPIWDLEMKDRFAICVPAVFASLEFMLVNLRNGQTNILILALTIFAFYLYRKQKDAGSGFVLGIAAVLKIFSLPLAFWMLLRQKMVVVLGTLLGVLTGLAIPALVLGWNRNLEYIAYWIQFIAVRRGLRDHFVPFFLNTSFEATLLRLFSDTDAFESYHVRYKVMLFAVPDEYIHIAAFALMGLLACSVIVYRLRFRNGHPLAIEVGGPVFAMLCAPLLTPVSEKYHFVFLMPAYFYVAILWRVCRVSDRRMFLYAALSFVFGTMTLKVFWGDYFSKMWFACGTIILCTVFLACAVFRAGKVLGSTNNDKRMIP